MNRKERRELAKTNIEEIKRAEQRIKRRQEQVMNDGRAEAMFLLHALAIHEIYGFGAKRCLRVMERVDSEMSKWLTGESDIPALRKRVEEEIGIKISFGRG